MKLIRHAAALLLLAAAQLGPGCAASSGEDLGAGEAAISATGTRLRTRSGMCLRAVSANIDLAACHDLHDRGWDLVEAAPGYDQIRTANGGCLSVRDVRLGAAPYVVPCVPASPGSDASRIQLWTVELAPSIRGCNDGQPPEYTLRSLATGQCLGVSADGSVLPVTCNPLFAQQRWALQ